MLPAETADSAGAVDSITLQGRLIAGKGAAPAGFRSVSVIVDRGLGSITVALPEGFRSVWGARVHPVVANGVDGVHLEFRQPDRPGHVPDRTNLSVRITDPHNKIQWGVTCDLSDALRATMRDQCLRTAGTFRPLPAVSG